MKKINDELNALKKENENLIDQIKELETFSKQKGGEEARYIWESLTQKLNEERQLVADLKD